MTFSEIRSVGKLGAFLLVALAASNCTTLNPNSMSGPVFSITTDSISISEADDGLLTVRFQQPRCLVASSDTVETVVTSRSGGTIKEQETGSFSHLVGVLLKFIVAIF